LILDLSIPKNVNEDVRIRWRYINSHGLFVAIDETLKQKKIIFQLLKLLSKKSKKSSMFGPKAKICAYHSCFERKIDAIKTSELNFQIKK
jgi:hypothetical protein